MSNRPFRDKTFPPGHFHSPLPDIPAALSKWDELNNRAPANLRAIDLNLEAQLHLIDRIAGRYQQLPFSEEANPANRYHYNNGVFCHADGIALALLILELKPRRIIEIGSGYSSALMLDINEKHFSAEIELTFIEPNPSRLERLLKPGDFARFTLIESPVQSVSLANFADLTENDMLFIDSSHVAKVGSDVNHLLFEILPLLEKGVVVHFHDIFYPFEYPREWIEDGVAWNESYILRAFLSFNAEFEILLFNSFLGRFHSDLLRKLMPLWMVNPGGSLWLRRVTDSNSRDIIA